jgi:hypothetical protein
MNRRPRLITLLALAAVLLGALVQPVPLAQAAQVQNQPAQVAAAPSPPPPPPAVVPAASPPTPASQPALAPKPGSAQSKLHLTSTDKHFDAARSKEVAVADPNSRRYDNPDGTHTMLLSGAPQKADGGRTIDLSLTDGPAGDLRPKAAAAPISIATSSGSSMASVEVAPGKSLQLLEPGARSGSAPAGTRTTWAVSPASTRCCRPAPAWRSGR